MDITALRGNQGADPPPLEKLAANTTLSEAQKVAEVSRQFESVLLRQILGQARKPVVASKLTEDSVSSGIYRDMVTAQLADGISKSGSFGLARALQAQLTRQLVAPAKTEPASAPALEANTKLSHD